MTTTDRREYRVTFQPSTGASTWWDVAHDGIRARWAADALLARREAANRNSRYRVEVRDGSGPWLACG